MISRMKAATLLLVAATTATELEAKTASHAETLAQTETKVEVEAAAETATSTETTTMAQTEAKAVFPNKTPNTEIYTISLHDDLPTSRYLHLLSLSRRA